MSNKIVFMQDQDTKAPVKKYYLRVRGKDTEWLFPLETKGFGCNAGRAGEALDREIKLEESKVIEMNLCETHKLILKPNQLYRFVVAKDCKDCIAMAKG